MSERPDIVPVGQVPELGAVPDKKTLCTAAIQKAVDLCHDQGGGTVLVPPGDYLSSTIHMKSHVSLHISIGATLWISREKKHFKTSGNRGQLILAQNADLREAMGKSARMISVPVLSPRLSSYWIGLVTRADLSLARELVEGLRTDLDPSGPSIWELAPDHALDGEELAVIGPGLAGDPIGGEPPAARLRLLLQQGLEFDRAPFAGLEGGALGIEQHARG